MQRTSDYDYELPRELIAQTPINRRDASRLLVLEQSTNRIKHARFYDLTAYLRPGDILVGNNSRVIPARLFGRKTGTGGRVELLLLKKLSERGWRVLIGGKRIRTGTKITLEDKSGDLTSILATVIAELTGAIREVEFSIPIEPHYMANGQTPLPPYIHEPLSNPERYQTVYSRELGSAASPTAGLHFSADLLISLRDMGVLFDTVTLHIGLDTFKPVSSEFVVDHHIHSEWALLTPETAKRINETKLAGGRLVAVGTTAVRLLETAALRSAGVTGELRDISRRDAAGEITGTCPWRPVSAFGGQTDLFIYPGYRFRAVDAMITNFHLPQSSLLMLISAFAGRENIRKTYQKAIVEQYRFYSFGDAMLII